MDKTLPIVVIGAGPVGLAAAAHLAARGLSFEVLEAGDDVAANVRDWGHVRLFSTWKYNVDKVAARLLEHSGWRSPDPDGLPTGDELVDDYLRPLTLVPEIVDRVRFGHRVVAITRRGADKVKTDAREQRPFVVRFRAPDAAEDEILASAIIDATGTWATPNPLGASGLPAIGELALREHVRYGVPDILGIERARYAGRTTLVVGAGHSAANSILALTELARAHTGTRIVWATRGNDLTRVFGGGAADGLPARGHLGEQLRRLVETGALRVVRGLRIERLRRAATNLEITGLSGEELVVLDGIDEIIVATGQRPELSMTRELRLALDPWLESSAALGPLIDPNLHSCGTVRPHGAVELAHPEAGFYVIGSKSYGRAPTFLLATGYEQARSVVAMLAGDREAALRVELDLPETGVCSVRTSGEVASSCCAPAPQELSAAASCCA